MADLTKQITEARQSGYSDEDIAKFLGTSHPELSGKVKEAQGAGYSAGEILNHLGGIVPGMEQLGALPKVSGSVVTPKAQGGVLDDPESARYIGTGGVDTQAAKDIQGNVVKVAKGVKKVASGDRMSGAADIAEGAAGAVGRAALPLLAPALAAAPGATIAGAAGSQIGGALAKGATQLASGDPDAQRLASVGGQLVGGTLGGALGNPISNAAENLAAYRRGFMNPEAYPGKATGPVPDLFDAAHAALHPSSGLPSLAIKAAKSTRSAAGMRAVAQAQAARGPYIPPQQPEGGHSFNTSVPPPPRPLPNANRPAPGWAEGPGPEFDEIPPVNPRYGPLPSGRVPGPAPQPPPPAPRPPRAAPGWVAGPGPGDAPVLDASPIPGPLPSGRVPGKGTAFDEPLPTPAEAGFGGPNPEPLPPRTSPKYAANQAAISDRTAQVLYRSGVTPEKLAALRDPDMDPMLVNDFWEKVQDNANGGKEHSDKTKAMILKKLEKLHEGEKKSTPSTPIPPL